MARIHVIRESTRSDPSNKVELETQEEKKVKKSTNPRARSPL
jgi:hypothetical protein